MKFVQLLRLSIFVLLATFSFNAAQAQSPSEQVGVGITGGGMLGGHVAYAITPAIHLGTQFGFVINSSDGNSSNQLAFGPYGKFILAGTPQFKPFGMVGFGINSVPSGLNNDNVTTTSLFVNAGAEYFLNRNFGVYGMFTFIDLGFGDNSYTTIGIGSSSVGVEWFFD